MVIVASDPLLVGRGAELERLADFVASLSERAAAVVIHGGPGAGKTALWRGATARAGAARVRVVRSRCAEVELPIAFGALTDLLGAAFEEVADDLPGPQRHALAAAFGRADADDEEGTDWLVLAVAVLASLQILAREAPLLLAIDDLQWLDPGSRRVLAWALRRVGEARVGLIATLREGSVEQDPLALADVLPAGRFSTLDVPPLSAGALQHLIAVRLGVHLPRPTLTRVQRASGGNPMFALEFARGLALGVRTGPAGPLEVPASLEQLMRGRVAGLPRRLRPLLELVGALERATLPLLDRALEGADADALLEEAIQVEALALGEDGIVRFTHPLLAATVYFGISPRRRRQLHRSLGGIVDTQEERARHAALAAVGPDGATATLVEDAASAAAVRGALDAAAELATEAVRLTPASDSEGRRRRLLATVGWLVETGEFAAARAQLDPLLAEALPAPSLAEALLLRAECEFRDRRVLVGFLREAERVAPEPRQRWQALIRLAHHDGWVSGDAAAAANTAREALGLAQTLDEATLVEASLAAVDFYEAARGSGAEIPAGAPTGRLERLPRMQWWQLSSPVSLGCRLMWAGEFDRARVVLEGEFAAQDSAGREAIAGFVLCWLSELEWRAGEWSRAEGLAREATERLGDINPTAFPRALLAAGTGDAEQASRIAEGALVWALANDEHVAPPRFRWLLGMLELSRGEAERALVLLAEAQGDLDGAGIREPGYLPVLPDLAESLAALGRLAEAEGFVERLEGIATKSGHRWVVPAAQRARALLLLARGDASAAAATAAEAALAFAAIGSRLDAGRALLVAGNARRRIGLRRQAVEALSEAVAIFTRLGAHLWLKQAEQELHRASPRPRHDRGGLTAAETRVAALAAGGRKNKEIAAALYTTIATVEAHLTRIYRKLEIRSRSELARRVADGTVRLDGDEQ